MRKAQTETFWEKGKLVSEIISVEIKYENIIILKGNGEQSLKELLESFAVIMCAVMCTNWFHDNCFRGDSWTRYLLLLKTGVHLPYCCQ